MATITYDDDADFALDNSEFELFETENEMKSALGDVATSLAIDPACRRRKPCTVRYCYRQSNGQIVCVRTVRYCCVQY